MKNTIFSKRLSESMKSKGISQTAMAKLLRTTQQTVSRWCVGFCEPDFNTLLLICGYLDEDVNYLLGYDERACKKYAYDNLRDIVGGGNKFQKEQYELSKEMAKNGKTSNEIEQAQKDLLEKHIKEYCEKLGIEME